jgi:hypothetical protein
VALTPPPLTCCGGLVGCWKPPWSLLWLFEELSEPLEELEPVDVLLLPVLPVLLPLLLLLLLCTAA